MIFPRRWLTLFIIAIAITPGVALALDPNPPGQLAIEIFVSPSTSFMTEWTTTPSSHPPTIKRIRSVRIGQLAYAGFLVSGYSRNEDRAVDFVVDVRVVDPSGKAIFEKIGWARHDNTMPAKPNFILANNILDLMIESGDPIGPYKIEATVHDQVAKRRATTSYALEVVP